MRSVLLLPVALLAAACAKPAEPTSDSPAPATVAKSDLTPEKMAEAMRVPLYPGSNAPDGMSSAPEKRDDGSMHYSLVLATKDPVEKVGDWYAKKLNLEDMPGLGGKSIVGMLTDGTNVIITIGPEAGRTLIRVKSIVYAKH